MIFGLFGGRKSPADPVEEILDEMFEMGENPFAPMSQVLQLAHRLSETGGIGSLLGALDGGLLEHEAFRVRRVGFIALRNLGPAGARYDPAAYEKYTVAGLADPSPYVRLEAAWLAGVTAPPDGAAHLALREMTRALGTPEEGSQEVKTLERAEKALAEIESRRSSA